MAFNLNNGPFIFENAFLNVKKDQLKMLNYIYIMCNVTCCIWYSSFPRISASGVTTSSWTWRDITVPSSVVTLTMQIVKGRILKCHRNGSNGDSLIYPPTSYTLKERIWRLYIGVWPEPSRLPPSVIYNFN